MAYLLETMTEDQLLVRTLSRIFKWVAEEVTLVASYRY